MENKEYIIVRSDRYDNLGNELPDRIVLPNSTREQATCLAKRLSNYYARCEYIFYVEGEDDE